MPQIVVLFFLLCISLCSCTPENSVEWPASVKSAYSPTYSFTEADALRYAQDYEKAQSAYQSELKNALSPQDSFYCFNQMAFCQLIINRFDDVANNLAWSDQFLARYDSIGHALLADYFYNKGKYHYLKNEPDQALHFTHRALKKCYKVYAKEHLKTAQSLTLLALIHEKEGNLTDSIHHYTLLANDIFLDDPKLQPYDWEMEYVFALGSWFYLAHERGAYHCQVVLEKLKNLPFENKWLEARAYHFLANLQKKQADGLIGNHPDSLRQRKLALYESADQNYQKAISIGNANDDSGLMNTFVYWIINTTRFQDSVRFFNAISSFEEKFSGHDYWYAYKEYLLGYYYYFIDFDKSIQHYTNFVAAKGIDPNIHYIFYASAFHCLRVGHKMKKEYEQSVQILKQSYQLYGCLKEDIDISNPALVSQIDSTKRYCMVISGYFVRDLVEKYRNTKDLKDLQLATAYMDFVDKHNFKSLLHRDEDAFLTFQREAGTDFYARSIEVSLEFWNRTKELKWVEKAFSYMENLKSFLLYRDMLRYSDNIHTDLSLSDSIRMLQGQVNQMLFSSKPRQALSRDFSANSDLVKRLNNLQFRRSKQFKNLDLEPYRNNINIQEIRSQLGESKGLVNYFNHNQQLFGIYLDTDTAIFYRNKTDYPKLAKAVTDYRNSLEKEVRLDQEIIQIYKAASHLLYAELVEPFSDRLSEIDQLIIIPDELLDPVPFEALLTQAPRANNSNFRDWPFLLKKVQIVYGSSWKVHALNQQQIKQDFRNSSIGFWTSPDLATVNGLDVIEQSIQSHFGNNYQVFNQQQGGKKLFSINHPKFNILHLLLHARSSRVDRYDNQVRFGNTESEKLYGYELYLEKFQSNLVVLASCESATGTPKTGEGTFSLARSFINSGVSEIIAAQYLVPQNTTGQLLSLFYQNLASGANASTALQMAKVQYLETITNERHAYPRFWAGMILLN